MKGLVWEPWVQVRFAITLGEQFEQTSSFYFWYAVALIGAAAGA